MSRNRNHSRCLLFITQLTSARLDSSPSKLSDCSCSAASSQSAQDVTERQVSRTSPIPSSRSCSLHLHLPFPRLGQYDYFSWLERQRRVLQRVEREV